MLLTYCIPCQHGHHERHHEIVQAVPEGVMGGARCRCGGECVDRHKNAETVALIPAEIPVLMAVPSDDQLEAAGKTTKIEASFLASCDWGECEKPADYVAYSPEHGWLPVCNTCHFIAWASGHATGGPYEDVTD